ncbi:MAG: hypothetical protein H6717_41205 [Polyangiaceae bacterium]|nr:hypothetical protein [Polyangiaceae bacterium]
MNSFRRYLAVVSLLATLVMASGASADDTASQKATAEALFVQGREAMQRGDYSVACEKFEDSQATDAAVGTLLNLATCYEKLNRTASAWVTYKRAAALARTQQQAEREAFARKKADALTSRLAYVVVEPSDRPDDLTIRRDEEEIPRRLWDKPIPVDPGEHQLVASAPGRQGSEQRIIAIAGKTLRVVVPAVGEAPPVEVVQPRAPEEPAPAAVKPAPPAPAPSPERPSPARDTGRGDTQRLWGVVVGGSGVVALGVGGVFLGRAISKNDDSSAYCRGDVCDSTGKSLRDDARSSGNLATVFMSVGAVATVGGAVMFLTAPREPTASWWLSPTGGPRHAGLLGGARF